MEMNITAFVNAHADNMYAFSDSIANSGLTNIGALTWQNAMDAMADESAWLTSDLAALVEHFSEYGAWERAELDAMSGQELNALLVQFVAGDFTGRAEAEERDALADWEEREGGRLALAANGEWFYYVGC